MKSEDAETRGLGHVSRLSELKRSRSHGDYSQKLSDDINLETKAKTILE